MSISKSHRKILLYIISVPYKFKQLANRLSQSGTAFVVSSIDQQMSKLETQHILLSALLPFFTHKLRNQMCVLLERGMNRAYTSSTTYAVAFGWLGLLPSMASFFIRQSAQRKGPSHGFDVGEKKSPALTDKPSLGWSTWQTAHLISPEDGLNGTSGPNLKTCRNLTFNAQLLCITFPEQ